jgi:hypothetical protein
MPHLHYRARGKAGGKSIEGRTSKSGKGGKVGGKRVKGELWQSRVNNPQHHLLQIWPFSAGLPTPRLPVKTRVIRVIESPGRHQHLPHYGHSKWSKCHVAFRVHMYSTLGSLAYSSAS